MLKPNNFIFKGLKIAAWFIFVWLCIETGALILNFFFNLYNPEVAKNLYIKLDLSEMYKLNKCAFLGMYSIILLISILKAYLFYLLVELISKINLSKPFNRFVSKQILKISYYTFSIGLISAIARQIAISLQHYEYNIDALNEFWMDSRAFILMAAVIYVIAIIFSKGIEFQEELEDTV